jgi:hypothetical protein
MAASKEPARNSPAATPLNSHYAKRILDEAPA